MSMNNVQARPLNGGARLRTWWWAVGAVVLVGVIGAILYARQQGGQINSTATKAEVPVTLEFAPADVALVEQQALVHTISINGSLVPATQSLVKATVPGVVLRVLVREGEAVRQGQVVAEMDATDLRSRLEAAMADQAERRSRLAVAVQNRDTNEALLRQNFISKIAFDQARNAYLGSEAAVQWADAQVDLARRSVAEAQVRSPIVGIVAKRFVNAGERVQPDGAVVSVVDLSRLELEVTVPASDVPLMAIGQVVEFQVAGFAQRVFNGSIERINPVTEAGSRSIKLFVAVANKDASLRGGMFAQGAVTLSRSKPVTVVPASSIFEETGQSYVFTVEAGKVAKHAVVVGQRSESEGLAEIKSGIEPGVHVVRVRMSGLKAGAPARLVAVPGVAQVL